MWGKPLGKMHVRGRRPFRRSMELKLRMRNLKSCTERGAMHLKASARLRNYCSRSQNLFCSAGLDYSLFGCAVSYLARACLKVHEPWVSAPARKPTLPAPVKPGTRYVQPIE